MDWLISRAKSAAQDFARGGDYPANLPKAVPSGRCTVLIWSQQDGSNMEYLVTSQGPADSVRRFLPVKRVQQGIDGIAGTAKACPGNKWFRSTLIG
jgi:hypothetical protein